MLKVHGPKHTRDSSTSYQVLSRVTTNPEVSVFIVSYNTRDLLHKCLESVFDTEGDIVTEVFVADNNSSDGSAEMVESEFPGVVVKR